MRVAIVTNVIPTYRRGFYERLCHLADLQVTLFCQPTMPDFNIRPIHNELDCFSQEIRYRGSEKGAVWQWLPVRSLWSDFDIYVFYGNPRIVSNVIWATLFRFAGKHVILWGQGHTAGANQRTERLRLRWWQVFDRLLVYTDQEAVSLEEQGFANGQVIGLNNGLDQKQIDDAKLLWPAERLASWQKQYGIFERPVLLSVARLDKKNRFDQVIEILPRLLQAQPNLIWIVIGDGVELDSLQSQAAQNGVADHIRWLGSIYDEDALTPWFLSSDLLVHPGAIGLTLMHAFGYALPVITHDNPARQMPEIAALQNGVNGLIFAENNIDSLYETVALLLSDGELRHYLGENALQTVRTEYNVDVMVERFQFALHSTRASKHE